MTPPKFFSEGQDGPSTDLIPDILIDCIGPMEARMQLRYLRDEVIRLRDRVTSLEKLSEPVTGEPNADE